jgi:hypothetical protein
MGLVQSFDYVALHDRLLHLPMPRLPMMLDAIASAKDGRSAWEQLGAQNLVPAAWASDPRRIFLGPMGSRKYPQHHPITPQHAAIVAAAIDTMQVVEELAWRIAEALEPWGQPIPRQIHWNLLPPGKWKQQQLRGVHALCDAMHLAGLHAGHGAYDGTVVWPVAATLSSKGGRNAAQRVFERDVSMHEDWTRAITANAKVPRGPFLRRLKNMQGDYVAVCIPEALVGRSIRELADPLSPLLAIWEAGCAPGMITDEAFILHLPPPAA